MFCGFDVRLAETGKCARTVGIGCMLQKVLDLVSAPASAKL